jgi:hypothetical protein
MYKINIIFYFIVVLIACGDSIIKQESQKKNAIGEIINDTNKIDSKNTICEDCDKIFLKFPLDSFTFERLYGYPYGTRQAQDYEDIELFFNCLHNCFNEEILINVVELSASIDFEADGPFYLQSGLTKFLKEDKSKMVDIYSKIECNVFRSHIEFLFSGVENTDFIEELKESLESIELDDPCKRKVIQNMQNMIESDH